MKMSIKNNITFIIGVVFAVIILVLKADLKNLYLPIITLLSVSLSFFMTSIIFLLGSKSMVKLCKNDELLKILKKSKETFRGILISISISLICYIIVSNKDILFNIDYLNYLVYILNFFLISSVSYVLNIIVNLFNAFLIIAYLNIKESDEH